MNVPPGVLRAAATLGLMVAALTGLLVMRSAREPAAGGAGTNRFVKNGLVVEFSTGPATAGDRRLREGDHAQVRFRVSDAASGLPVRGLNPAAWMDIGAPPATTGDEEGECKRRIALYLKGHVGIRPMIDLNSYYLLVLNQDPSISVIDPIVGMTGKTSLYATVLLERPGADWVKSRDRKWLFVSMPRAGEVAVVDAERFKVAANLPAGREPTRVALQNDGRYLWVGNNAAGEASGVTVIDTETRATVATIPTGRGHHEITFSHDDRYAFVSNRDEGSVSVIDVVHLKKVRDLATGPVPISLGYSPLSQALYVADGKEGTVSVVAVPRFEVIARIAARPGLGPLRFSEDGRWGLVVNPAEHAVHVLDTAENRLVETIPVGGQPFQVTFTRAFAYVRLLDSERVALISLGTLGKGTPAAVHSFAAGSSAPKLAGQVSMASSIAPASIHAAVFVVSPADNMTYFYMEGMNAPMGAFGSYGHSARAVEVVDRSLDEIEPGVYATTVRIPAAGRYDVGFLLDAPPWSHCFDIEADADPDVRPVGAAVIEHLEWPAKVAAGASPSLRFRLTDPVTRKPLSGLTDVKLLTFASPGRGRAEVSAREVGDGVYAASPALPRPGAYFLYVAAPSGKLRYGDLPYRSLVVEPARPEPNPGGSR